MKRYDHNAREWRAKTARPLKLPVMWAVLTFMGLAAGKVVADEDCIADWFHLAWITGTVTLHEDSNRDPYAIISDAQERCEWNDGCEGTTKDPNPQTTARPYILEYDRVVPGGNDYVREYKWRADSGCRGGKPTYAFETVSLPKHWSTYTGISGGELSGSSTRAATVEQSISVGVTTASDNDSYTIFGVPGSTVAADGIVYKWTATGGSFSSSNVSSPTWTAPNTPGSYTLTCTIDDLWLDGQTPAITGVASDDLGNRNDAAVTRSITVTVSAWSATLKIKRKGTDDTDYASSTTVAAGAVGNDAHQAVVEVTLTNVNGDPVAGVIPLHAVITSGGLAGAGSTDGIATIGSFGTTDANGKATASFTSGRRVADTVTIKYPYDPANPTTSPGPTVSVSQVWGDGTWICDEYFEYDEVTPISYKRELASNVNVGGHDVDFVLTGISGWEWDPDEEDYFEEFYYDYENTAGWNTWKTLAEFEAKPESGTGGGTYNTELTVAWDDDFMVDRVEFNMVDKSVFALNGGDF